MGKISDYIYPISSLASAIIGVGVFSLPYITLQVGLWPMLIYLVLLTVLVFFVHLVFSEVAVQTKDFIRLPGYAKIHLGRWGEIAMLISTIVGSFGILLVYIIIGGGFLGNLLIPVFGGVISTYVVIFFLMASFLIFWDMKTIAKLQFWGLALIFLSFGIIFIYGSQFFKASNLIIPVNFNNIFLPYGPILFALWGAAMIPEIEEMLGKDKKRIKKVVFLGTMIPAIFYLLFIIASLLISGTSTSSEAIVGLQAVLGLRATAVMFFAGFLAVLISFISVGLVLKNVFYYDLKVEKRLAWLLTIFFPFLFYYLGLKDFIGIIGFIGGVSLTIDGILIFLMYRKLEKKKYTLLIYSLMAIFVASLVYEIINFIK